MYVEIEDSDESLFMYPVSGLAEELEAERGEEVRVGAMKARASECE